MRQGRDLEVSLPDLFKFDYVQDGSEKPGTLTRMQHRRTKLFSSLHQALLIDLWRETEM